MAFVDGQRPGERSDCAFRGDVGGGVVLTDGRHQAGDIDDIAFCLPQGGEREFAGSKNADQIQVYQLAELFDGEIIDRFMRRVPAGIVDQAIDTTMVRDGGLNEVLNIFSSPDIAVNETSTAESLRSGDCLDRGRSGCAFVFAIRANDDVSARFHELLRARFADPAAAPGD
jgi:hypothetical protein